MGEGRGCTCGLGGSVVSNEQHHCGRRGAGEADREREREGWRQTRETDEDKVRRKPTRRHIMSRKREKGKGWGRR